jgi:uncharacterized protein (DUF2267 family)
MVEAQRADRRSQPDKGNELFNDVRRRVRLPAGITAEDAVKAVMCTVTQHLFGADAQHVLDGLPRDIRPTLERCERHHDVKPTRFDRDELVSRVADHLGISRGDAEDITSAVLLAISARVPRDELVAVANLLPLDLRDLWVARRVAPPVDPHPILTQIEKTVPLPEGVTGVGAFTVVMRVLTHRLSRGEARHLVERLPADLKPLVEGALEGRGEEPEVFDLSDFLARVHKLLLVDDPEQVSRAVFRAVYEYLPADVFEHVMSQLPGELQDLWVLP